MNITTYVRVCTRVCVHHVSHVVTVDPTAVFYSSNSSRHNPNPVLPPYSEDFVILDTRIIPGTYVSPTH